MIGRVLLMAALAGGSTRLAQSTAYGRCLAAAKSNSNRTFACNGQELKRQDMRVDADYRRMQVRVQHDRQKQADVRTEQRDWLQHRDSVCREPVQSEHIPCLIRETAAKADALDTRLR